MAVLAFQSDRVEDLVARLVTELERDEENESPLQRLFMKHLVVIPTRNLETYLTLEIAARRGVASNLEFLTIQRFIERLLPRDDQGELPVEILDQASVTRLMVSILSDEAFLSSKELAPVRSFLHARTEKSPESVERRRYQLAFRVARLFEDYSYSRRELLASWAEGESGLDALYGAENVTEAHRAIESWQRACWHRIFGAGDRFTLPAAIYHFINDLQWPPSVHIFGQSYLPGFFRDLFSTQTLDESRLLFFYVMNPCLEHWSHGVAGDRDEDPVFDILADEGLLSGDEYPMALELWGRAGRDFQRLLDEVAYDRRDLGRRPERREETLLEHFQAMIRDLKTDREVFASQDVPHDESLHFWSMPGVQRECEVIASEIWELVTTEEDLRFNDIAVVVQPAERTIYQTHLQAAFARTGNIPCNIIDVAGEQRSPFLEAARLLLELPLGSFRRRELLSLLIHPCLLERFPEVDATDWIHWCDELNIFQGADADDLEDTYLQEERFTWRQGMRRLVLGSFMTFDDDTGQDAFELAIGDRALIFETGHDKMESVGVLLRLVDTLVPQARRLRREERPLLEWMEHFRELISHHLRPRDRREERTRIHLLGRLQEIADADLCPQESVGYRTAFDFAAAAMAEMEETLGQYLADGVVVSAFKPMRPIPFKVVFVTGLGENRFPAPDPPEMLDLRRVRSRLHDVNPRHRDLYLFLETLMSTRSRLYLSWVGRHGITGDHLEPASVVYQLQEMILAMTPRADDSEKDRQRSLRLREELQRRVAVVEHPLRRFHESYFPDLFGESEGPRRPNHHAEAYREARVRALACQLSPEVTSRNWSMADLGDALSPESFQALRQSLKWTTPRATMAAPRLTRALPSQGGRLILQLYHLRRFLECPLQGSARTVLRLFDEDDQDFLDADHEPFEAEFLQRLGLLREVLVDAIARPVVDLSRERLAEIFEEKASRAALAGELPAGVFLEAERRRCIDQLETYVADLRFIEEDGSWYRRLRLGSPPARVTSEERREPLYLDVPFGDETLLVELHGVVGCLEPGCRSLSFAASPAAKPRHFLQGALDQYLLRAHGYHTEGSVTVVDREGAHHEISIDLPDEAGAREYLAGLTADLLSGVHDYLMPVEAVAALQQKGAQGLEDFLEAQRQADHQGRYKISSVYGPVRRWQDAPDPTVEQVQEALHRRFGPIYELLLKGGS